MPEVKIRYVGSQPRKRASAVIEKSAIVWEGHGDVQLVPEADAAKLLVPAFSKIWERVVDEAPVPVTTPELPKCEACGEVKLDPHVCAADEEETEEQKKSAAEEAERLSQDEARERLSGVVLAISKLKKSDFTAQGQPKLQALRDLTGRANLSGAERDAAWALVQESLGIKPTETVPE